MTEIPCLRCGQLFEVSGNRRRSHFCTSCRQARTRERSRVHAREVNDQRRSARDSIREIVNDYTKRGMDEDYADGLAADWWARAEDYFDQLAEGETIYDVTVPRRMPEGSNAPAGPDEGTTASFRDVRERLDELAARAARDPWWDEHPHWAFALHDVNANDDPDGRRVLNAA